MKASNLTFFYFDAEWTLPVMELDRRLAEHRLVPCGAYDMEKYGFTEVDPEGHMALQLGDYILASLAIESRILPGSVVTRLVKQKAEECRQQSGMDPGKAMLGKLREQAIAELMPKSFTRINTVTGFIDRKHRRFCVLTGSQSQAEKFAGCLRGVLDDMSIVLPTANHAPSRVMADWVATGHVIGNFELGADCDMQAQVGNGRIRYSNEDLRQPQVQENARDGFEVVSLGLTWEDRIDFVLTKGLALKKIKFIEAMPSETGTEEGQDAWNADALHVCGELSAVLDSVESAFAVAEAVGLMNAATRNMDAFIEA